MKLKSTHGVEETADTSSVIDGKFRYDQFGYGVPAGHYLGLLRQKGFKTLVDDAIKFRSKEDGGGSSNGGSGGSGGSVKKPRQKRKQPMEGAAAGGVAPTTLDLSQPGLWGGTASANFAAPPPPAKRSSTAAAASLINGKTCVRVRVDAASSLLYDFLSLSSHSSCGSNGSCKRSSCRDSSNGRELWWRI
jgi:hypothetical protein